ncbi:hypothetical protein ACP6H4_22195 [Vibrio harveyi]|uniref:hypothetical protein n=1 Tax=Vibrio harveyi TaxID=669 RepID=UPI003CE73605
MKLAEQETVKNNYKGLSQAYRSGDIINIARYYGKLRFLIGECRAANLAFQLKAAKLELESRQWVVVYPSSFGAFAHLTTSRYGKMRLYQAIERNNALVAERMKLKSKRIRKQDEAPQVGADSSTVEA